MRNAIIFVLAFSWPPLPPPSYAQKRPVDPPRRFPPSTPTRTAPLSWDEVRVPALAKFAAADTDHDGTLDAKESRYARNYQEHAEEGRSDKDGTLSEDEYLAIVKQRFDAADRDHDGTLSAKELASHRGGLLAATDSVIAEVRQNSRARGRTRRGVIASKAKRPRPVDRTIRLYPNRGSRRGRPTFVLLTPIAILQIEDC